MSMQTIRALLSLPLTNIAGGKEDDVQTHTQACPKHIWNRSWVGMRFKAPKGFIVSDPRAGCLPHLLHPCSLKILFSIRQTPIFGLSQLEEMLGWEVEEGRKGYKGRSKNGEDIGATSGQSPVCSSPIYFYRTFLSQFCKDSTILKWKQTRDMLSNTIEVKCFKPACGKQNIWQPWRSLSAKYWTNSQVTHCDFEKQNHPNWK